VNDGLSPCDRPSVGKLAFLRNRSKSVVSSSTPSLASVVPSSIDEGESSDDDDGLSPRSSVLLEVATPISVSRHRQLSEGDLDSYPIEGNSIPIEPQPQPQLRLSNSVSSPNLSTNSIAVTSPSTPVSPVIVVTSVEPTSAVSTPIPAPAAAATTFTRSYCRVLFPFVSTDAKELSITEGEIVTVLEKKSAGWWRGLLRSSVGLFPSNYVAELADPHRPAENYFRALGHYKARSTSELELTKGDIIIVSNMDGSGW
jgi:hypothetical protein